MSESNKTTTKELEIGCGFLIVVLVLCFFGSCQLDKYIELEEKKLNCEQVSK